jgi:sortase A
MRRILNALSTVLIVAGLLLIGDAGLTLVWQEPVSAVLARMQQDRLADELARIERRQPTAVQRTALARLESDRRRIAFLARLARREATAGEPFGRIEIPAIGLDAIVVEGTGAADLRKGPGHYPETTFPGLGGTVAIAGHRTTYGAPFGDVDQLHRGEEIVLEMPYGRFTYAVERTRIVSPDAVWVIRDQGFERLVLSACHPRFSAAKRIIVFARLRAVDGRGAAARPPAPAGQPRA